MPSVFEELRTILRQRRDETAAPDRNRRCLYAGMGEFYPEGTKGLSVIAGNLFYRLCQQIDPTVRSVEEPVGKAKLSFAPEFTQFPASQLIVLLRSAKKELQQSVAIIDPNTVRFTPSGHYHAHELWQIIHTLAEPKDNIPYGSPLLPDSLITTYFRVPGKAPLYSINEKPKDQIISQEAYSRLVADHHAGHSIGFEPSVDHDIAYFDIPMVVAKHIAPKLELSLTGRGVVN